MAESETKKKKMAESETKKKKKFFRQFTHSLEDLRKSIIHNYVNKYYNVWMSKYEWDGLDEEIKDQQQNFIMRKFWSDGTVSCFEIADTTLLGFAPYGVQNYGMYDFPEQIKLINTRGVSKAIIPEKTMIVNQDVVIGWCLPSRKSVASIVNFYAERLAEVDLVINTNLNLNKMPFIIGCTQEDREQLEDVVNRILNNEVSVLASIEDVNKIQVLATQVPYVIDKLSTYKKALENELNTILGIDNNGDQQMQLTHIAVDAINSNNEITNNADNAYDMELKIFTDKINSVFGRQITVKNKAPKSMSVKEENGSVDEEEEEVND